MAQRTLQEIRKLKNVPVANERLYREVAYKNKVSPKQVEECIQIVGRFISDTIKRGAFETVMVPYFGKFRTKVKKLQGMSNRGVMPDFKSIYKEQ